MPSTSSAAYRRAKSSGSTDSSLYTGMTTERTGAGSVISRGLAPKRAAHALAHALDVGRAHLWEERQRHGLARDALGVRKHSLAQPLVAEERREVDRFVRHARADAFLLHRVHESLARRARLGERQQDGEHVPAVAGVVLRRQALGREEVVAGEAFEVAMREALARAAPFVEVAQLLDAEARGHVGEVVLGARALDVACAVGEAPDAVETQLLDRRRLLRVLHHERSALDGGHVLVGMEAERDQVAGRADGAFGRVRADGERR